MDNPEVRCEENLETNMDMVSKFDNFFQYVLLTDILIIG